jgi:hypothetical protein
MNWVKVREGETDDTLRVSFRLISPPDPTVVTSDDGH